MSADSRRAMEDQLSRTALLYLLAVFSVTQLLLLRFLPLWLLPVAVLCLWWRLRVFAGRASFPSATWRALMVLLAATGIYLQYRFALSLDLFVTLLLLGFALKLLEIYHRADARWLLYLSLFVLMTVFLFSQTIGYTVLVFASAILVLSALVSIHSDETLLQRAPWQPVRKGLQLFCFSLPFMLFLFVVMPRLPPLWTMPLQKQQAKTGMSDSMTFGDVASLARSSDLAFRVSFAQNMPLRSALYWYGLFLDHFDGVTWTDSCGSCAPARNALVATKQTDIAYQVILEPTGYRWAYVLQPSIVESVSVRQDRDGLARLLRNADERKVYAAVYRPEEKAGLVLADRVRYLALPVVGNAAARRLAQQWREEAGNAGSVSDRRVLQRALDFYHRDFSYTLQPPVLQGDRIDGFLFNSRQGFCEHFAGSFVYLMRAAGIPARVAIGYMGGEINERDRYVVVRQYDAHAWAEVWLPDVGWQRVDPTAAVAPERIDLGFAGAYETNPQFADTAGISALRRFSLLNQVRLEFERFDYLWSRWVLGFDNDSQQDFLRWSGLSPWRIALWTGVAVVAAFVLLCLFLFVREWWVRHEHPATQAYRRLCRLYGLLGIARAVDESPLQYAARIRQSGFLGAAIFSALSQDYYQWLYCVAERPVVEKATAMPSPQFSQQCRRLCGKLLWRLLWLRINGRVQRVADVSHRDKN